jgi:hypothetical protein
VVGALALVVASGTVASAQTAGGGFARFGGSGKLTARSGSTLELQGFSGNTSKVIVTSSTKYRQIAGTDASAITKGACVRVASDDSSSTSTTKVSASQVTVLDGTQQCAARTSRGNFPNRRAANGEAPSGGSLPDAASLPEGGSAPNGGARPNGSFPVRGVTGTVKSVSGDTVVVSARVPKQTTSNSRPKLVATKVTVTLTASTTVEHTVTASDSVLVVGTCITSQGSTDSVGTVTATTVTASQPDSSGACTAGFGGGGFPGGGFAGAGNGSSSSSGTT